MWFKRVLTGSVLLSVLGLTACHEDPHCYDDCYADDTLYPVTEPPQIYTAHMVDTYATNSEYENEPLALSPYVSDGEFEVFWDMWSESDFFVEVMVNDVNSTHGSRVISSDWCSPYSDCYSHQYQYCYYSSDFYLSCETSSGAYQSEYVGDLFSRVPQNMYFFVQVCDTSYIYCESISFPVLME